MTINVDNPTYVYKNPVCFLNESYKDSKSLVEAFLENWDMAVTSFRAGRFLDFWGNCEETDKVTQTKNKEMFNEIYDRMWKTDDHVNVDVLFSKVIHLMEPALNEIPEFLEDSEQVRLSEVDAFKEFFRKQPDLKYLQQLFCENFASKWEDRYDKTKESILYACQMQRERVFSCWGYNGAENQFLRLAESTEAELKDKKPGDFFYAYSAISEELFSRDSFLYLDKECQKLADFIDALKPEIIRWSMHDWNDFVDVLFGEETGKVSFLEWLNKLGEQQLIKKLQDWKERWNAKEELPEKGEMGKAIQYGPYLQWGSICEHDIILKEIEEKAGKIPVWMEEHSKLYLVKELIQFYKELHSILREMGQNALCNWEELALEPELKDLLSSWEAYEEMFRKHYEDMQTLIAALHSHDVVSCWQREFMFVFFLNGDKIEDRRLLTLLACVPITESYQKDCNVFLEFLKNTESGFSDEEIEQYICDIFANILLKLFQTDVPDEAIDFYMRLLLQMTEELNENKTLEDILDGEELSQKILNRMDCNSVKSQAENIIKNEEDILQLRKKVRNTLSQRPSVQYDVYFKTREYLDWKNAQDALTPIENEWVKQSEKMETILDEIATYVKEHCLLSGYEEIKEIITLKTAAMREVVDSLQKKEEEWNTQLSVTKARYEEAIKAQHNFEVEWDKKQEAIKAAEKKKKVRKAKIKVWMKGIKKGMTMAPIVLLLFVIFVVVKAGNEGKDLAELILSNRFIMERYVDRDGTLTIPQKVLWMDCVDISEITLPDEVKTLIIPDGVKSMGYIYGKNLEEVKLSDSMKTFSANFSGSNFKKFSAENLEVVEEYMFYDCTALEEVYLPKVKDIGWGSFQECSSLEIVYFPEADDVDSYAFYGCEALRFVYLPMASDVNGSAFGNCPNLVAVSLPLVQNLRDPEEFYAVMYLGSSLEWVNLEPDRDYQFSVVLDRNGKYSKDVLETLSNSGEISISYENFDRLSDEWDSIIQEE